MAFGALALLGETVAISDPADFESPTPFDLGGKTVEYTGSSAEVQNTLALTGSDGTLNVSNSNATLTWAGDVSTGKTLFSNGAGTLSFTGDTVSMSSLKRMAVGTTEFIGPQTLSIINYFGCAGSIVFDNVTATLGTMCVGYESAGVNPTAEIKNGAVVKNNSGRDFESERGSGIPIGASKTIPGTMSIGGASQLSHVGLAVRENSRLSVGGNSTLSFSRPILSDSLDVTSVFGDVAFDGGTLKSFDNSAEEVEATLKWAQWFNGATNLYVGSNGITLQAPSALASLWPRLTADAGSSGASVTKTGTGALAMRPTALPVAVDSGDLRLAVAESDGDSQKLAGVATFAAGTAAQLSGLRAAAKMDISSAPTVKFHPSGVEAIRGQWKRNGWATVRPDGYLQLTDSSTTWGKRSVGSVFRKDKVSVDKSFSVDFSVQEWNVKGAGWHDQYGGFAVVFQNAAAGTSAVATDSEATTLCGYGSALQNNAFALLFYFKSDTPTRKLSVAKGSTIVELGTLTDGSQTSYATLDKPVRIGFSYDAEREKGIVTWATLSRNSSTPQQSFEFDLDLEEVVGASSAYFGFTGVSYGGWMEGVFTVGNIAFSDASTVPAPAYVGGVMNLAAGASRSFKTFGDKTHAGFLMDTLSYGDQTVLDIASLNAADPEGTFVGFENMTGAGTLVKRGTGNLALVSEQAKTASVKVEQGGLSLCGRNEIPSNILDWDWCFNKGRHGYDNSALGTHGGLVVGWGANQGYTATARRKMNVTGSWRLSFDAYPTGMNGNSDFTDAMGYAFGVAFHDDPRGLDYSPSREHTAGLCNNLKNAVGGMVCPYRWAGEVRKFGYLVYESGKDYCYYPAYGDVRFTDTVPVNGDVIHFEMSYDETTHEVSYVVRHNDKEPFQKVITVDLSKRIPSGEAYLMLSLAGASAARLRCEYANLKFERLSAQEVETETVLGALTSTAATASVRIEGGVESSFRIGSATLPGDGTLSVTAPHAPAATLELGSLSASHPELDLGTNVTVAVDSASGTSTLTVRGGTLKLSSASSLAEKSIIELLDNARLCLGFEGGARLRVKRNGQVVPGVIDSAAYDWVSGSGRITKGGMIFILR